METHGMYNGEQWRHHDPCNDIIDDLNYNQGRQSR